MTKTQLTERIAIRIGSRCLASLNEIAELSNCSLSQVIRSALVTYVSTYNSELVVTYDNQERA